MKIYLADDKSVAIQFSPNESKFALMVLRSLYAFTKLEFIREAYEELEDMSRPKIPYIITHKTCEKCCIPVSLKDEQHLTRDGVFTHLVCPILKPDSTRER